MSHNTNHDLDVVGIGNAIVDVLVKVDDSFLQTNSIEKGNMTLLNEEDAEKLYASVGVGIESSGGSAANTLAALAELDGKVSFIGRVRNDQLGEIFKHDICSSGALYETKAATTGPSTARCLIFVTPDAQRTMCTYLGASVLLEPEDLDLSIIRRSKILYLEGYLWDTPAAKKAFISASKICKNSGGKVALSLSDAFCVNRHRESFIDLVENHVDILFSNESEIIALYKTSDFQEALKEVRGKCEIAALTLGERGSIVLKNDKSWEINPYNFGPLLDTTGAGDLYAGGFLHGYTNNFDLKKCGEIGSICSGHIVTQMGSRSKVQLKHLLDKYLN